MKKAILIILLIPSLVFIGGILKYNIEFNHYKRLKPVKIVNITHECNTTEVFIVGSIHFETELLKRTDLYNHINDISPSVILYEGDSNTVKRINNKTDYFSRFVDAFKKGKRIEKPVTLKYLEYNPDCILLPYEWELRDKYHRKYKLRKKSKALINLVIGLYSNKQLTKEQTATIDRFLELNNVLTEIDRNATMTTINSLTTDSILKQRQHYIYYEIPEIAQKRKELFKYYDFIPIHMNYWDMRNKAMVQNILKQIQYHPNQVIIVLTGYYHRYYLIEELKKYETEYNFSLKGT